MTMYLDMLTEFHLRHYYGSAGFAKFGGHLVLCGWLQKNNVEFASYVARAY